MLMFHNCFIAKQDCYKTTVLFAKMQVTEQYMVKCPKRLHVPLYKSNYSKKLFPSALFNVNLVKYWPKIVYKNKVI